jgi:hypothetical protein
MALHSDEKTIILRVIENYLSGSQNEDGQIKVTILPPGKSIYIEQNEQGSRSVMLEEYRVEGKVIRAGYSARSGTVYLSIPPG